MTESSTAAAGCRLLLVGAVGLLIYLFQRGSVDFPPIARSAAVGAASLGIIGVPFLLMTETQGKIASTTGVLVLAGVPVLITVFDASMSSDSGLRLLPFGLLGMAGLLVLLPVQAPTGVSAMLALGMVVLAMISTALCLMWLHRLLDGFPFALALCLTGFLNGTFLVLAGACAMSHWDAQKTGGQILMWLIFDLPETMLLVWLAKAITPQRLSARYVVGPLLTVVEGLILMRPGLEARTLLGMALLGIGAYGIFRSGEVSRETHLRLG